jgi:transcriptional regulator with XRE-family HTH domain
VPTPRIVRCRRTGQTSVGRRARESRIRVGRDIRNLREDGGVSQRALSRAAGIDHGFLSLVERGDREPSITALTAIASALGAELGIRLYPGVGPRLRDPIQARIVEELVRAVHPRWERQLEVPVIRPARGFIDLVLTDRPPSIAICTEVQSELRRIEQLIRWSNEKAAALPSAPFWDRIAERPRIERLMVVRSTRVNRQVVARFGETLAAAYPARAEDAYRALTTGDVEWPGSALLWAEVRGDQVTILDRPPRTVDVGR